VWFALAVLAARLGGAALALLYGLVGTVAALQVAYAWRRARPPRPHRLAAAAIAAGLAASALAGLQGVAIALPLAVLVAMLVPGPAPRSAPGGVAAALATLRCAVPPGLAAAVPVLAHRVDPEAALTLVLLVSAYEAGDYLVGSGASNLLEGPVAGAIGVLAVSFAVSLLEPQPFSSDGLWLLGAVTALCCPLGQLAASAMLPRGIVFAPALRRIDSLIVTGPAWVVLLLWWRHLP
jgi:hypothetical protein